MFGLTRRIKVFSFIILIFKRANLKDFATLNARYDLNLLVASKAPINCTTFFNKIQIWQQATSNNKPVNEEQGVIRSDDLSKVLTDVKQLRGRQTSVDSQLTAMKQENAVLWRELAILRQKHVKQQQIVNKVRTDLQSFKL